MGSQKLQGDLNRRIANHIPLHGWDVTVAIVIANWPAVHLLGTGSLFEIGGFHFVVTAAHVINAAHEHEKTIGICDGADFFISVDGNWISSAPVQFGSVADLLTAR